MLTFKNKKETERELAHIDVFSDGVFIGYIIKGNSLDRCKWVFSNKNNDLYTKRENEVCELLQADTKDELKVVIQDKIENLKQVP